jgi:hypothetical protein
LSLRSLRVIGEQNRLPKDCRAIAGSLAIGSALVGLYLLTNKLLLAKEVKPQALDVSADVYLSATDDFVPESSAVNFVLISAAEKLSLRMVDNKYHLKPTQGLMCTGSGSQLCLNGFL